MTPEISELENELKTYIAQLQSNLTKLEDAITAMEEKITELSERIKNIKTDEEKEIRLDALFVSIGREPVTDFLKGKIELNEAGYVVADESTKTSVSGVFAAGDVRTKPLRQIVTAVSDGAVAVHFAEEYIETTEK